MSRCQTSGFRCLSRHDRAAGTLTSGHRSGCSVCAAPRASLGRRWHRPYLWPYSASRGAGHPRRPRLRGRSSRRSSGLSSWRHSAAAPGRHRKQRTCSTGLLRSTIPSIRHPISIPANFRAGAKVRRLGPVTRRRETWQAVLPCW